MVNLLILLCALFFIGFLIARLSRKSGPSRYERKAQTPWNSLNEGEDPTL